MSARVYGDRWEVIKQIGEGGQSHVFLVVDRQGSPETTYALKRLKDKKRSARFFQEIEIVKSLSHPNLIRLIDFGHDVKSNSPYLVMEFCAGGDLAEHVHDVSRDRVRALRLFTQICEGVAAFHQKGITHRDLKPANVLCAPRTVLLSSQTSVFVMWRAAHVIH